MNHAHISLNQLIEFSTASANAKRRIVKQQIEPNPILIPWYQLAKGSIRRHLSDVKNITPINEGIEKLLVRKPQNKRQTIDRMVSIEALQKFIELKISRYFKNVAYEVIKPKTKNIILNNVEILVVPDIIIKANINGNVIYGGVKIHISKTKPFTHEQCQDMSSVLFQYIKNNIAQSKETVSPELCLCIDVFSGRIVTAKENNTVELKKIKELCEEVKQLWFNNN